MPGTHHNGTLAGIVSCGARVPQSFESCQMLMLMLLSPLPLPLPLSPAALPATGRRLAWCALAGLAAAASALPVQAQTVQPGLWETRTQITPASSQARGALALLQQQIPNLPAAQRQQLDALMARQGVSLDGNGLVRSKSCITPAMAERLELPVHQGDCTTTLSGRSASGFAFQFQCAKPALRGEGEVTLNGPKAYTLRGTTVASVNGHSERADLQSSGQWVAGECTGAGSAGGAGSAPAASAAPAPVHK